MALQKAIQYNGLTLNYHRLVQLNINWSTSEARAVIGSYVDEEHRRDGFDPFQFFGFDWDSSNFPFGDDSNPRQKAYDAIKVWQNKHYEPGEDGGTVEVQEPGIFADAEDC